MDTDKLIQRLAGDARLVRPLPRPSIRTATWLALAAPYLAFVVYAMSPRADLVAKSADPRFLIEQAAALATAVTAAVTAFATVVPGYDRRLIGLPLLPLTVWLGSLGFGCAQDWIGVGGLSLQLDFVCLPKIALVGAAPAVAMAIMLRRGAPLSPHLSVAFGGLAAAALGDFGLRLFHTQDAGAMVLVWQVGSVFLLACLAGSTGRFLLSWNSVVRNGLQMR